MIDHLVIVLGVITAALIMALVRLLQIVGSQKLQRQIDKLNELR